MVLSCQNVGKAFHEKQVFKNCSFHIEDHEKAAIVGINGAGKTTLLRILTGELDADEGMVVWGKDVSFGYLPQNAQVEGSRSIYDEVLEAKKDVLLLEEEIRSCELQMKQAEDSALEALMEKYTQLTHRFEQADGYSCRSEVTGVLKGLGFTEEEFSKQVSTLSGGQKTRVALGRLLLTRPDLIILDEPTNHLDMSSIAWLETWLINYRGAVLIVSHDRYFLDKIATKIIELDGGKASVFSGSYSDYAVKKEQIRAAQMHAYLNQQQEIKHQEAVIEKLRSFNREKSIRRAESREKMLQKMEVLEKPTEVRDDMHIQLKPRIESGNDVLSVEGLAKAFDSQPLFTDLSFFLKRGEHVAVIGDNGTGKTTILKIINGLVDADAGEIRIGSKVQIGYYDQEHHVLHPDKTIFEEISDEYPTLTNTEIRNVLAAFLFTGEDVFKQIKMLSGGERGRVSLAKLMLSEANFLILDEPTNHLDITSKEILEDALNNYTGTVLYVSHDRYFINRTASRILELEDGKLTGYPGNYDYYLEKKAQLADGQLSSGAEITAGRGSAAGFAQAVGIRNGASSPASESALKQDWKSQKEAQAAQRKKENALKRCEERIAVLEERSAQIDAEMALPEVCTDVAKLQALSKEKAEIEEELLVKMEEWEALSE
ncbi:MAG TPA: ABC-F family ATP-binding cassette domain-containing protein [Candidatus Eisenbergiella intestinigallinarum]|uniref:ABC-F family ATP-binding cassette domain-containing protein n=1 Tax=Candidatus Eisenbergiella intestinigallinarum TaxID=2838549 RepID=A0A9D2TT57_9FIRM|nr:ABC-F family ATP-binding cassette domain-containing protein [Candidatus Eisenbergiella intestinigallinarum]